MINVIDSIMGSGKTTWSIRYMNTHRDERFVYITPFLEECKRIQNECPGMNFVQPDGYKQNDFKKLLRNGENICTTHALLSKMRLNDMDKDNIDSFEYTFILDEAVEVIQPVTSVSQSDVKLILDSKWIDVDKDGFVHWVAIDETKKYKDIATMAKSGTLMLFKQSLFMWLLPIETIKAMKNLFIMTFLFEASHMCTYLKLHGMQYSKMHIENEVLMPGEQDLKAAKTNIRNLLNIYEGKLNSIGDKEDSLSATKWKKKGNSELATRCYEMRRKAGLNARSYFRYVVKAPADKCMWSAYKTDGKETIIGYSSCFVPFNSKATNEFRDRTCLAYLVNVYETPDVYSWFKQRGYEINQELVALSTMIQWIWRSAIRNGKSVNLFLPSSRMRNILQNWLNN